MTRAPNDASAAAEAAIIALRAVVPEPSRVPLDQLALADATLTRGEAIVRFASFEAPVHCRAREFGGLLSISCERIADATELSGIDRRSRRTLETLQQHLHVTDGSTLELRGADERIILTIGAFDIWMRIFQIGDSVWRAMPPDEVARRSGVVGTIEVYPLKSPLLDIVNVSAREDGG